MAVQAAQVGAGARKAVQRHRRDRGPRTGLVGTAILVTTSGMAGDAASWFSLDARMRAWSMGPANRPPSTISPECAGEGGPSTGVLLNGRTPRKRSGWGGAHGSRRIQPAHVGCPVGPDGSRRIQKDRLDDQTDDQGASDAIGWQGEQPAAGPARRPYAPGGGSMLLRVDQDGRIPDRSHTRGLSGTSRRSTPGLERRSAAKRSPSATPR